MRRWLVVLVLVAPWGLTAQDRVVIVVRHAERAPEPRNDPVLSDAGSARAQALARALVDAGIGSVLVTPTVRTRTTGAPTAEAAQAPVIEVGLTGGVPAHLERVAEAVRARPAGETVLVVGHSNTVTGIIRALGGPEMPNLCETEYAHLFVLTIPAVGSPRLVRATYGVPDPVDAATCR